MGHVPLAHKAKTLLALPLRIAVYLAHNRFSREIRSALWHGVIDGARARLGPPATVLGTPARRRDRAAEAVERAE